MLVFRSDLKRPLRVLDLRLDGGDYEFFSQRRFGAVGVEPLGGALGEGGVWFVCSSSDGSDARKGFAHEAFVVVEDHVLAGVQRCVF